VVSSSNIALYVKDYVDYEGEFNDGQWNGQGRLKFKGGEV